MEDSTAISSAAFSQHHHRDGELGKSEKRRDLKSSVQLSVLIACSGRWQRGHIWLIVLFWLPTARWMVLACVHTRACIHFVYILGRCVCVCAHIPAVGVCPCWFVFVCVSVCEKSSDFWIFALLQVWESFTDTGQLYEKLYRVRSSDWFVGGVALQIPAACFHCTFVMSRIVCVCLCVHVWVFGAIHRKFKEEALNEGIPFVWICVCVYLCARVCVCAALARWAFQFQSY